MNEKIQQVIASFRQHAVDIKGDLDDDFDPDDPQVMEADTWLCAAEELREAFGLSEED